MRLVFVLALLIVVTALVGSYIGPGRGYYGAGVVCFVLILVILHRVFVGGPSGKGLAVRPEAEGPADPPREDPK